MSFRLAPHLEQITSSCEGINALSFPPPKIFINALLSRPDITSLIRDTEAHERALFSVPAAPAREPAGLEATSSAAEESQRPKNRRHTVFNVVGGEVQAGTLLPPLSSAAPRGQPVTSGMRRRPTAVAAVLGGNLHAQLSQRATTGGGGGSGDGVDMTLLLHGAEKLCQVYPLPGANERIATQRRKHAQLSSTLQYYEAKVEEQARALELMNSSRDHGMTGEADDDETDEVGQEEEAWTAADLRREEEEVRELERKKRELQGLLRSVDKDLKGLMDM